MLETALKLLEKPTEQILEADASQRFRAARGPGGKGGKDAGKGKKGGKNTKTKFNGECHYCHKPGHMAKDCRQKARDEKTDGRANAAVGDTSSSKPTSPRMFRSLGQRLRGAAGMSDPMKAICDG